jgi:hypothetical protein
MPIINNIVRCPCVAMVSIKIENAKQFIASTLYKTNHTKFSLRKVSTVVPALWQTLFLIFTACLVFKI